MARKRRGLTDDDRAVWEKVASTVARHTPPQPQTDPGDADPPPLQTKSGKLNGTSPAALSSPASGPGFRIGEKAKPSGTSHDLSPSVAEHLAAAPLRMDRKAFGRMKKGKLVPEARIDLHGMTQDQAHGALTRFIHDAYARQFRLVLVITGKGKDRDEYGPIPVPRGVLKHQVPHWLAVGPMRLMVLQVTEAHLKHGGSGAYYVYLKRRK
ncbi:MAG: Smr/MutS family protein [Pseudomonadota bacterium]